MCTLTVAWRVFDDAPVVVAANRDEHADRPSTPPREWDTTPRIIAPRDEKAGGTWIGYNEHGVFVALTNRWTGHPEDGDRSRGLLVRDALHAESARAALDTVRSDLADRTYEPFHLFVADASDAFLLERDVDRTVTSLAPGHYVAVNVGWTGRTRGPRDAEEAQTVDSFFVPGGRPDTGRAQAENARDVRRALVPDEREGADAWLDRASGVLGDHHYGVCVHRNGFGTQSSSLVKLGDERTYRFADGPPCETAFEPVESL